MAKFKVNKEKCIGCSSCIVNCLEGMEMDEESKAKIIKQEKIEECGGEELCPYEAIEKLSD